MKNLLNKLKAAKAAAEAEFESRHDFYDAKPTKWQDSEKGEDYAAMTTAVEQCISDLESMIEDLE